MYIILEVKCVCICLVKNNCKAIVKQFLLIKYSETLVLHALKREWDITIFFSDDFLGCPSKKERSLWERIAQANVAKI